MSLDLGRAEKHLWAALLAVNVATHFVALGERAASHDESLHAFYSYELAEKGRYQHDPMMHGPLLFHSSALVFRLLGASDATARLLPALAGIGLVPAVWLFRRYLGRSGALAAAALVTISPSLLFYGRYLRNDVYMALFALLWLYGALRYLETRRPRYLFLMTGAVSVSFCAKETAFLSGLTFGSFFAAHALLRAMRGRERLRASPSGHVALVMLTMALPFLVALVHVGMGWDPADFDGADAQRRALGLLSVAFAASALLAFAWGARSGPSGLSFRTWLRLAAAFWALPILLYTTVFTNVRRGLTSGIVGSLGYWLGQHEVARGGQPWFYYLMLAVVYEPLALLASLAVLVWLGRRSVRSAAGGGTPLLPLLGWWVLSSFGLYSWAGEKMPWLLVHLALPMCLLGGWALSRLWAAARGPGGRPWRLARPLPVRRASALLALGVAALLGAYTLRSALQLAFVNADLAVELLVYAHGTPDIKRTMREIDEIAARTGEGPRLQVAYDDDSSWPMTWYLRTYPRQRYLGTAVASPEVRAPVVVIGSKNVDAAQAQLAAGYVRRDYLLIWWPPEDYMRSGPRDLWAALGDPSRRRRLLRYLVRRETGYELTDWPLRHEFKLYVERELVSQAASAGRGARP